MRLVIAFPQSSFTTTIEKYEKLFPTEVHFQVTLIGYYISHILIQGSGLRNEKVKSRHSFQIFVVACRWQRSFGLTFHASGRNPVDFKEYVASIM